MRSLPLLTLLGVMGTALIPQAFAQGVAPVKPEMMESCPGLVAQDRPPFRRAAMRLAALKDGEVRINYIGHSTFLIESPKLVRIATDYNDYVKPPMLPDIVTMNRAHSTHYTDRPEPGIKFVLRGWKDDGRPTDHDLNFQDVRVRSVATNIRDYYGGSGPARHGNSIFIFEVANLCIAHLGHLHHTLNQQQLNEIGRIDVVLRADRRRRDARSGRHDRSAHRAEGAADDPDALLLHLYARALHRSHQQGLGCGARRRALRGRVEAYAAGQAEASGAARPRVLATRALMPVEITHRTIAANGIEMHVAEAGEGPLVLLCHGWPELWYSWRHQLVALADAGFHAVAPDMRGFGRTSAPADPAAYTILHMVGDVVALVSALGQKRAAIVGHDWGAPVAWHAAQMRPDVFTAVAGLSVPFRRRGRAAPLDTLRKAGKGDYYWIYFQDKAAEDEFARDAEFTLRRLFHIGFGETPRDEKMSLYVDRAKGFLGPAHAVPLPPWLSEADIAMFAAEYPRTGFRGGLNWYRNIDRNWELTAPWQDVVIAQPALFIAGTNDAVITGSMGQRALDELENVVPNLKRKLLIDGAGHWIQQERPHEVNAALIGFLREHLAPMR